VNDFGHSRSQNITKHSHSFTVTFVIIHKHSKTFINVHCHSQLFTSGIMANLGYKTFKSMLKLTFTCSEPIISRLLMIMNDNER
jgi:hypothetical protein